MRAATRVAQGAIDRDAPARPHGGPDHLLHQFRALLAFIERVLAVGSRCNKYEACKNANHRRILLIDFLARKD